MGKSYRTEKGPIFRFYQQLLVNEPYLSTVRFAVKNQKEKAFVFGTMRFTLLNTKTEIIIVCNGRF